MSTLKIRVGPAGWSYRDWAGVVYPKPRPRDFHEASYLADYFDTIEINTSFYHPMKAETASQWVEHVAANPRFLFTAKLWQKFTHEHNATAEDERTVRVGFDVLREAGKLGAVLIQFPFSFHRTPENFEYLKEVLKTFADYPLVVEVRHASWNDKAFYEMLRERGIGFCNVDQPIIGRSLKPTSRATAPVGYVRLHGRRYDTWFSDDPETPPEERYNYLYSIQELEPWRERIQAVSSNADATFVITNNHYGGKGIVNALQLLHLLSKQPVSIPPPLFKHYPELERISSNKDTNLPLFFRAG